MKKQPHSCLHANYPETKMKCIVCYDGEVVIQTHLASKREHWLSISVKNGAHQITNANELAVTTRHERAIRNALQKCRRRAQRSCAHCTRSVFDNAE